MQPNTFIKLLTLMLSAATLVTVVLVTAAPRGSPTVPYVEPAADEVHLAGGAELLTVDKPDASKLYIVESGANVIFTRPISDSMRTPSVRVIARGGSRVEAHGTNIDISAEANSQVTAYDGVVVEATGAKVFVRGNATLKAFAGTTVFNTGSGEEHAFAGSITYTRARGRTFAEKGSTVYAKSPDECDACTQVAAAPGSIVYVYDGAEAFAKEATVYVYKGGEVGCNHDCTLFLYPGAEFNYGPRCVVHNMSDDDPPEPFKDE